MSSICDCIGQLLSKWGHGFDMTSVYIGSICGCIGPTIVKLVRIDIIQMGTAFNMSVWAQFVVVLIGSTYKVYLFIF